MSGLSPTKKPKKIPEHERENLLDPVDGATQRALEEIDVCQNELDELNERSSQEILSVEQKYNQLRKPFYEKRGNLIECIPNFWVTAMMNHPDLSALIEETEEDCLHHLTRLEVEEADDIKSGYSIRLFFDENPYFENEILVKDFHMGTGTNTMVSESTQIIWKEGCTLGNPPSPPGSKRLHEEATKSFFRWFADNVDASTDDVAELIKEDLWHNPLQYYLVPDQEGDENGVDGDDDSDSSGVEEVTEDVNKPEPQEGAEEGGSLG